MARSKKDEEVEQPESEQDEKLTKSAKQARYVVAKDKEFRDASNFNHTWTAGQDVSHFDEARLTRLEELGLIEKK